MLHPPPIVMPSIITIEDHIFEKYEYMNLHFSKIGFFDAENSVALTPNGDLKYHSGVHSSCSKTRRNYGNPNGPTRSKLQSMGDSLRTGNPELVSPLGIRTSHPGITQNRKKSMTREPFNNLKVKKQTLKGIEDSNKHYSENFLQPLDADDKENLCNYQNQVDGLSKHIEATDLNRDLVMELNKDKIPSRSQFGTKVSYSGEILHG